MTLQTFVKQHHVESTNGLNVSYETLLMWAFYAQKVDSSGNRFESDLHKLHPVARTLGEDLYKKWKISIQPKNSDEYGQVPLMFSPTTSTYNKGDQYITYNEGFYIYWLIKPESSKDLIAHIKEQIQSTGLNVSIKDSSSQYLEVSFPVYVLYTVEEMIPLINSHFASLDISYNWQSKESINAFTYQ